MLSLVQRYTHWLHTRWPAGKVEKLPEVREDGSTNVPGLYVVGDLTGIPLLKFAADSGATAIRTLARERAFQNRQHRENVYDVIIVGASVSGISAALEARKQGLNFTVYEASEPFSTIVNFPTGKPIFTYPTDMTPTGDLQFHEKSDIKEGLLEDLTEQMQAGGIEPIKRRVERVERAGDRFTVHLQGGDTVAAHRVVIGIGRSGNFRKLGVPGEQLPKVYNRLHDPKDFCGQNILVVGGGDSALEAAIALGACGANVTLSYRKPEFSRPKPENVEKLHELSRNPDAHISIEQPSSERITTASGHFMENHRKRGSVTLALPSSVQEITESEVVLDHDGNEQRLPNDTVFAMIGREPPLDFFRRSKIKLRGEMRLASWIALGLFVAFCFWVYNWKDGILPGPPLSGFKSLSENPASLLGTIAISAAGATFWYTLVYSAIVVIFGVLRIRRRKMPYVTWQTVTLMAIQVVPLFILPEIVLPCLGHNGAFDAGIGKTTADALFPEANYGHGREYWRAYGFILAWPLMAWNWFTDSPIYAWLVIGFLQTFVLIPLIIYYWGKGAYCGWICSCGAMAETLGDQFRHKMPHGPGWNRLNMLGQGILALAFVLMGVRITGWVLGDGSWADNIFKSAANGIPFLNYKYIVDLMLAGVLGYGLYFWYSGRMWCRFACPLAALMHIYARFSRFRILADKKKCISCNVCTSVCHQGIDVMNFANKGLPLADPECVRCSACVQGCPTGVLSFGRIDPKTGEETARDTLPASPVQLTERGKPVKP